MSQRIDSKEELSKCKTTEDITGPEGLVQKIIRDAVEQILGEELEKYISDEKGSRAARDGSSRKTLKTFYGNIGIDVLKICCSGFEPEIIKKRTVVEEGLEFHVIFMYSKG